LIHPVPLLRADFGKDFDRFIRKFDPDVEVQATMAIVKGFHADHGTAVYLTQEKRRCLPLNTNYGLSDDDALWATFASWSGFRQRRAKPRATPGRLCYPAEYSHVFEKFWDHLPDL
jgi:hypothetical protein